MKIEVFIHFESQHDASPHEPTYRHHILEYDSPIPVFFRIQPQLSEAFYEVLSRHDLPAMIQG